MSVRLAIWHILYVFFFLSFPIRRQLLGKASETNTAFHFIKIVENYRARESTFQSLMRGEDMLSQPPSANEL